MTHPHPPGANTVEPTPTHEPATTAKEPIMNGKIALEEHVSTKLNNTLWDSAGEADRNGEAYMADVEAKLLDTDERIAAHVEYDPDDIDAAFATMQQRRADGLLSSTRR